MKDFKKHYQGDINCFKKQLAKSSINPSDNISSKRELKIHTYPLLFKGFSMNHLTKNKHFKGRQVFFCDLLSNESFET